MEKAFALKQDASWTRIKKAKIIIYPAVADGVDLPELSFGKNAEEEDFVPRQITTHQTLSVQDDLADRTKSIEFRRLKTLLLPVFSDYKTLRITFHVIGRRESVLKMMIEEGHVLIEAHWNLFLPYYNHIKELPIVHAEILDIFTEAVFSYAAIAVRHTKAARNELRTLTIDRYRDKPGLLLASMDIFSKHHIYHIRPTSVWIQSVCAANNRHCLQIDISAVKSHPQVRPEFLGELTGFVHKIVKNYAFRYVDYLWTQTYKVIYCDHPQADRVSFENGIIMINIFPFIGQDNWKPALYLNIGYAIMLAILQSSGKEKRKETIYVAAMKTWNRYLSYDESAEQQSVHNIFGWPLSDREEKCCCMLQDMTGQKDSELAYDFMMLMTYSSKETFLERLNVLSECLYENKTGVYCEQLWNNVRNMNASLVRDNINHSNLIELLRNDNIDHHQLKEFLRTGYLNGRHVVDVSEWLLLRTLLYDLINTPKVFRNDYKMLLKVLTKVNKSLIAYIWTLGVNHDPRYERVSAYISKLMSDIFVFNRVKVYEIIAEPEECLESEAVTGYLLNWAGLKPEERRFIIEEIISRMPRHLVNELRIQDAVDVDHVFSIMNARTSGIFGFYLHQIYQWGSTGHPLTEKIRSNFPQLLKLAQNAIVPSKRIMGGTMLLLLLAQIISDEQDGFASHLSISEAQRQTVRNLIRQCVHWDQMHYVMMIAGIAAGYMGSIDEWILQQFDTLLGRYDAGDRVVLRSVVQFDIDNLIARSVLTAKEGQENALLNKLQFLRFGVDPVVSDQANKFLKEMAVRCGMRLPEDALKKKDIRKTVLAILQHSRKENPQTNQNREIPDSQKSVKY